MSKFKNLIIKIDMSRIECADYLGLNTIDEIISIENKETVLGSDLWSNLAMLDSVIESAVITAVDLFSLSNEKEFILII